MTSDDSSDPDSSDSTSSQSPFDPAKYEEFMLQPADAQVDAAVEESDEKAAPQMDLSGARLGQYELRTLLGRGSLATVYLARQSAMLRDVAVKVLPPHYGDDSAFTERFRREAELAAQLTHPNILPISDFGEEGGYIYIVTRHISSGSLYARLGNGALAPAAALQILEQIAAALEYAHARDIVHLDVKPSNILIDDDQTVYLTDFGIARAMRQGRGSGAGTSGYVAPEQQAGEIVDVRADVYSLGALCFEMFTGRGPITSRGSVESSSESDSDSNWYSSDLPEPVQVVIRKALERGPDNRYANIGDFTAALQAAFAAAPEEWRSSPGRAASLPKEEVQSEKESASPAGSLSHLVEPDNMSIPSSPGPRVPHVGSAPRRGTDAKSTRLGVDPVPSPVSAPGRGGRGDKGGWIRSAIDEAADAPDEDAEDQGERRRLSTLLLGSERSGDERPAVRQLVDQPAGVGVSVKTPRRSIWPDAPPVGATRAGASQNGLSISGPDFARRIRAKHGFETVPEIEIDVGPSEPIWSRIATRIPMLDTGRRFFTTALAVGAVIALIVIISSALPESTPVVETVVTPTPVITEVIVEQETEEIVPTALPQPTATLAPVILPAFDLPIVEIELKMHHFGWESVGDGDQIYDVALSADYIWAATGAGLYRWDTNGDFKHFATEHGLASNRTRALAIQSDGTLWVGTLGGGLSRHDGTEWQTFALRDGLPGKDVFALAFDPKGGLWGATNDGLARFDGAVWQTFRVESESGSQKVLDLAVEQDGNLWAVTEDGLFQFDGDALVPFDTPDEFRIADITTVGIDARGALWIGTVDSGVATFDGEKWTRFVNVGFEQATIYSIVPNVDGSLWVGSSAGAHQFDGAEWVNFTTEKGLPSNEVRALVMHPDAGLWAGTRSGLALLSESDWEAFITGDGLESNAIQSLDFDSAGQVWIGMLDGGLATFDGNDWQSYGPDDGLASADVWSLLLDKEDIVWAGTLGSGLSRFDGEEWQTYTVEDGLAGNTIWTIIRDPRDQLWTTTSGRGAFILSNETFVQQSVDRPGEPWALDFDAEASRWTGTFDGELEWDLDGAQVWLPILNSNAGPADKVLVIFVDDAERIWLGTAGSGVLMSISNGARWEEFTVDDGLAGNVVWDIAAGPGNGIWFATSDGISFYNGTSWRSFETTDGLAANEVHTLGVGPDRRLWVGTAGGLSIVDPEDAQLYR